MAGPWYVRSAATGTGDGLSWTNAATSLSALLQPSPDVSIPVAGDTIYVADDHNESSAISQTWSFPGSLTNPNFIYCADHTVAVPGVNDLKTTGLAATTTVNSISINGSFYCYGLNFTVGSGANQPNLIMNSIGPAFQTYEACHFTIGATVGGAVVLANTASATSVFNNCAFKFSAANSLLRSNGVGVVRGGSYDASAVQPTNLIGAANGTGSQIIFEGFDTSGISSKTLVAQQSNGSWALLFKDCLFGASTTVSATQTNPGVIDSIRSDSANATTRVERYTAFGTMTTSTSIYRTGGASDGTTNFCRQIATPATRVKFIQPFVCPPIAVWNDSVGTSRTITVHATSDLAGGAFPNNDDIWIEVEYESSASSPLGQFATGTKANPLASGVAYSSDGSSWNNAPAGGKFAMSVSVTPQQKGPIYVYVKCARFSTNFYVDPVAVMS